MKWKAIYDNFIEMIQMYGNAITARCFFSVREDFKDGLTQAKRKSHGIKVVVLSGNTD